MNGTTVTLLTTLLLAASASCVGLRSWAGCPFLWVIVAIACFLLAVLLVLLGWILPGIINRRARASAIEPKEVTADQHLDANTPGNVQGDHRKVIDVPPGTTVRVPPGTAVRAIISEEGAADESEDAEEQIGEE